MYSVKVSSEVLRIMEATYKKMEKDKKWMDGYEGEYAGKAQVFLLGMDQNGVITTLVKLKKDERGGCYSMPKIDSEAYHKVYIKLAQKGLTPCGLARVNWTVHGRVDPYWRRSKNIGNILLSRTGEIPEITAMLIANERCIKIEEIKEEKENPIGKTN